MKIYEGNLAGTGGKFDCCQRFNDFIGARLVDGAVDALVRHQVEPDDIEIESSRSFRDSSCGAKIGTQHEKFVGAEVSKKFERPWFLA